MNYKGQNSDSSYLKDRANMARSIDNKDFWSIVDHWPLFVGKSNLARFLSIYGILQAQSKIPGDIAEFGSWRGANLMFMAKVMDIIDPNGPKRIHCFDNFEGLPNFSTEDGVAGDRIGTYRGSLEELNVFIKLYKYDDVICVHKGLIEDTLPTFLEDDKGCQFSLIYYDADLYEPAIQMLNLMHERVVKGGAFVFDEWNSPLWPGESIAVREFMKQFGRCYVAEQPLNTRQPSLILRKIAD